MHSPAPARKTFAHRASCAHASISRCSAASPSGTKERGSFIVAGATLLAFVAHLAEVALWALVFVLCGEFPDFAAAVYHSAENYTTLGYGDVVMSASWRLLGPLEAGDGMLMFGVSTALIFAVISSLVEARLHISGN